MCTPVAGNGAMPRESFASGRAHLSGTTQPAGRFGAKVSCWRQPTLRIIRQLARRFRLPRVRPLKEFSSGTSEELRCTLSSCTRPVPRPFERKPALRCLLLCVLDIRALGASAFIETNAKGFRRPLRTRLATRSGRPS